MRLIKRFLYVFTFSVGLSGCGGEPDGYDPSVRYSPRADVLVIQPPAVTPAGLVSPGRLDESIASLSSSGGHALRPDVLSHDVRGRLMAALDGLFGTPAEPLVPDGLAIAGVDLSDDSLSAGSRVYRRNCVQCHGLTGDGRGPTGAWVEPHPRDFRRGVFKTADAGPKPRVGVITALLRRGVPGTSMPAYDLLPAADVEADVGYVIHLSSRGETEFRVLQGLLAGDIDPVDVITECHATAGRARREWAASQVEPVAVPVPAAEPPSGVAVRRGHELFTGSAGCAACHADYGRRDEFRYDVWGTPTRVPDLTRGEYKWGSMPAEIARRVRHGIPGSAMPSHPGLTGEQVRDVVAFVKALPHPARLPDDVRDKVYPQGTAVTLR